MEKKNNKKMIIIFSIIVVILVVIIILLVAKNQVTKSVFSSFGNNYSVVGLNQNNKKEKNTIKYTDEQLKEEIYSFIERREDYAVFKNLKGAELAKKLNTGGKMVDTSKICNYKYGKENELTINDYVVTYEQGTNHIRIMADSEDDSVIAIRYFCNDKYTDIERDSGMTKIFEEIKPLLNTDEDMSFWSFNNRIDKWQSGNKELYNEGLGIKIKDKYTFYIVACPIKDFYNEYSTNL